jgi:hypothetical protein
MSHEPMEIPEARPPLGPGDDDPRSPPVAGDQAPPPLGPGDDDPRSPVRIVESAPMADVPNPDDDFEFIAPAAPGPGDPQVGPRHITRFPKKTPRVAANAQEQE